MMRVMTMVMAMIKRNNAESDYDEGGGGDSSSDDSRACDVESGGKSSL